MSDGSSVGTSSIYGGGNSRHVWHNSDTRLSEMAALVAEHSDGGRTFWDAALAATGYEHDSGAPIAGSTLDITDLLLGPHAPIVYYLRFDTRCKIGTTTNLGQRLRSVPYDEVLAVEAGGKDREADRLRQFQSLLIRNEWFRYGQPLVTHVQRLNA